MPTLRQRNRTTLKLVGDMREFLQRAQDGEDDYYWEPDPVRPVDAASTQAVTNDDLEPNVAAEMMRRKRRRKLTIPMGDKINSLAGLLGSIGLNIPE